MTKKKLLIPLFGALILTSLIVRLFGANQTSVARSIAKELNAAASSVQLGLQEYHRVDVTLMANNPLVVVCPPYSSVKQYVHPFSEDVIQVIEDHCLRGAETSHLFYLEDGILQGHQLLSGTVEAILGWSNYDDISFMIEKKETAGRSIRLQIMNVTGPTERAPHATT